MEGKQAGIDFANKAREQIERMRQAGERSERNTGSGKGADVPAIPQSAAAMPPEGELPVGQEKLAWAIAQGGLGPEPLHEQGEGTDVPGNPSVTASPCHLPLHKGGESADAPECEPETEEEQLQMPPALMPVYMSREDWQQMEREAAKGMMPSEVVTSNRRGLYFALVGLYAAVAAGAMPVGVAKAEKRLAIEAYNRYIADLSQFKTVGQFYKTVEEAASAYGKRACFDNAEAMYKAVMKAMPKAAHRKETWDDEGTKGFSQNNDTKI